MGLSEAEKILKRSESAFKDRQNWDNMLSDAYEFTLPMRNLYHGGAKGSSKMDRVFDSTAVLSAQKFASRLVSDLFPPFQHWVNFNAGPGVPANLKQQVTKILQDGQKTFFTALQISNFDSAIGEYALDLGVGTGAMTVLEGPDENPLKFQTVPIAMLGIDEGPLGSVDGVFYEHKVKVRNLEATWADIKDLPAEVKKMEEDNPEAEVTVLAATFFNHQTKKYDYKVVLTGGKKKTDPSIIVERQYEEHPWIITRWIKVAGEVLGRGPVLFALPDIKTVNKVKELILKNASLAISGVWAATDDGVMNPATIAITPGAVIPVASQGNLQPLEFGGNFNVAQLILENLQRDIRRALFDSGLPPEGGAVRSATEIIERIKEFSQDFTAPFGRILSELIRPLVSRCLGILSRKGIMPPIKVDGITVNLSVTSPLARLQAMDDIQAVVNWLQLSAAAGPQAVMLGAKVESIPAWIGEKMGVDADLIRTEDENVQLQKMVGALAGGGGEIPVGPANDQIPVAA